MDFAVPKNPFSNRRARSKRRSSILKTARPLEEIQNVSCEDKFGRSRRVSFANTIEVKEFSKEKPTCATELQNNVNEQVSQLRNAGINVAGGEIQISTPVKKKPRRISAITTAKIERLSIIPKLASSPDDHDFEIYEDDVQTTVADNCEITLADIPNSHPFTKQLEQEQNCFGTFTVASPSVSFEEKHPHSNVPSQDSDMELTLVDMSLTCMESCGACSTKQHKDSVNEPCVGGENVCTEKNEVLSGALPVEDCQEPKDDIGDVQNVSTQVISTPDHKSITPSRPCLPDNFELCPDSIQKTLLSSLKKKRTTTPRMLVPSAKNVAATYQIPQASHSFLEHHHLSSSKCIKTDQDHNENQKGVNSADIHIPHVQCHASEATNNEKIDMQTEETLHENVTSTPQKITCDQVLASDNALVTKMPEDEAGIWLHNVEDLHVPDHSGLDILVNESPGSVISETETTHSTRHFPHPHSIAYQPIQQQRQASDLLKVCQAISTVKSDSNTPYGIMDVYTPEATSGEHDAVLNTSALAHITFSQASLEGSTANDTLSNRQSILMSPSAFSKFLVKFNCDKTVVENPSLQVEHQPNNCYPETTMNDHEIPQQNMSSTKETPLSKCGSADQAVHDTCTPEAKVQDASIGYSCGENSIDTKLETHNKPIPKTVKISFADSLHIVQHRLAAVVNSLQIRLSSPEYLKTHEAIKPSLEKLMEAAQNGLCVLNLLLQYGELSGLSNTYQWDWERVTKELPSPNMSEEDLTGNSKLKADWIQTTHEQLLLNFYPLITALMEEGARLYPWQVNRLHNKQLQLACDTFELTLEFDEQCFEHGDNSPNNLNFRAVHVHPKDVKDRHQITEKVLHSHSITNIAETLWSLKL